MVAQADKSRELVVFQQYGITFNKRSGSEVIADCPFCEKKNKFYIEAETGLWKCFVCGQEGNHRKFVEGMLLLAQAEVDLNHAHYDDLARDRGLQVKTIRHFKIGFNVLNQTYLVPIYNWEYSKLLNVKIYNPEKKSFMNTDQMTSSVFLPKEFVKESSEDPTRRIWVCEGEWDGMAFYEMTHDLSLKDLFASVPSAGVFKGEWIQLFNNRNLVLAYDNDDPGMAGEKKAYEALKSCAASIKCVHWFPSDIFAPKNKDDVREVYIKIGAESAWEYLNDNLRPEPFGAVPEIQVAEGEAAAEETGEYLPPDCEEIKAVYQKWLYLPDPDVIEVIFGAAIANRMQGDPLWLFLVAPSGGTKTEFCMSLSDAACVECLSSLTPHTLVSGANFGGGDPSLLPRLHNRLLVIKDFTTILNLHPTDREAIFGILRDCYDGEFTKSFGNGITRHYKAKFGIIAGVTPAIEHYAEDNVALGERFLRYKLKVASSIEGRKEFLKRAMKNSSHEKNMRDELRAVAKRVLSFKYRITEEFLPEASEAAEEQIMATAQILSMLRGVVMRNRYTHEVQHKPFHELGTRLTKQFIKQAAGVAIYRGEKRISKQALKIIRKVAFSTIPTLFADIIQAMEPTKAYDANEISQIIKMPPMTTQRLLENLFLLQVCEREKQSLMRMEFRLKDDFVELMNQSQIFTKEV